MEDGAGFSGAGTIGKGKAVQPPGPPVVSTAKLRGGRGAVEMGDPGAERGVLPPQERVQIPGRSRERAGPGRWLPVVRPGSRWDARVSSLDRERRRIRL